MTQYSKLSMREKGAVCICALDDEPVFPGQDLEILIEGQKWLLGRFEWTGRIDEAPRLHVACGGTWEDLDDPESATLPIPPEIIFEIPKDALLRRPAELTASRRPPQLR